jgi:hypothetical protein
MALNFDYLTELNPRWCDPTVPPSQPCVFINPTDLYS